MKKKSHKKFIAASVTAALVASASVSGIPFNTSTAEAASKDFVDINSSNYFSDAVVNLTQQGIIKGFADGTFRPSQEITRAQAASILASALDLDVKTAKDPGFKDVRAGVWYFTAVAALVEKGIMSGLDKDHFLPDKSVTRGEMAKMLSLGYSLKASSVKTSFTDVPDNSWFSGYVGAISENKITAGVSATSFAPGKAVTRGQMAAFIYRAENLSVSEVIDVPGDTVTPPPSQDTGTVTPPVESTPPEQNDGGTTTPVEGPAAELNVISVLSFTYGSAKIYLEGDQINPTYFKLSEQPVATPVSGSDLPDGVIPFSKSAEIKNAQAGQYVLVYEADTNGKIIRFKQHLIVQSEIVDFNYHKFIYDETAVSDTIYIKFNDKLSAETLATSQVNQIIDILQITNQGTVQDFNKSDIASISWDSTIEDNPLLVIKFKTPITFAEYRKLQVEFLDTVKYMNDTGRNGVDFSFAPSTEALKVEHLVNLSFSPESQNVSYHLSNYLSEFDMNNTIQNIIYKNKENYLNEIKRNAATITNYASLQAVIDDANKLPYLMRAYVYFSSTEQNKLRLEFSEDVWLDQLINGTDFVIAVPESDVTTRNITAYTANTAETKSSIVYLTFDGPAIPPGGYAEVYITPSGGAKITDIDQNVLPSITLGGTYPIR